MHQPTSFVEARGHRLEYVEIAARGTDRAELLFLHEGLGSVSMWRDFPARLAEATGCRAIVYSRAGFGRSSPRAAPNDSRFMHEEALEVLPQVRRMLGIRRPVLVGHSTGASMALIHAGAGRWDVAGVVAMAPFAFVEESNLESIRKAKHGYGAIRERLARHHDDVDAVFDGWSGLWLDPGFKGWDIGEEMAGVRCPVLAILGERDEYCTAAQLDRIAAKAVNARVEILSPFDCGHSPHRDQPEVVLKAVTRFIESLET